MSYVTAEQFVSLRQIRDGLKAEALKGGTQHAYWDYVSDCERLMRGERTVCSLSTDDFIATCRNELAIRSREG